MNPDEINIAIAKSCGWKNIFQNEIIGKKYYMEWTGNPPNELRYEIIPNYFHDLNAIHEAEKILNEEKKARCRRLLVGHFGRSWDATASQRAEAFLRTIGKWKQSNNYE